MNRWPAVSVTRRVRGGWLPTARDLQRWAAAALGARAAGRELSVLLVGAAASRRLNAHYRRRDRATNVLSFAGAGLLPDGQQLLGELVLCAPVVAAEARRQHKSMRAHWAHLTVHGVLHLLGFDHEVAAEAAKMESREIQILDRLGFSNPYH